MDDGLVGGGGGGGGGVACEGQEQISGAVSSSGSSNADPPEPSSSKRKQTQASLCSSSPELNNTSSSESSRSEVSSKSQKKRKGNGKKLDRSKLRKGKWTTEEEEYTSRIIHYFSTGLLTLPEGATLRSYLAEKLNCDPMRITKKYAGASCLGRRVYQFRERIHPTVADIQIARTELDHLEQRFRMRVEGDAGGQKVQHSSNTSQALVQPSPQMLLPTSASSQNPIQNMLLGLLGSQGTQNPLQMPSFAGGNMFPGTSPPNQVPSMQIPSLALSQPPSSSSTAMPPQLSSNFTPTIAPMPPLLQTDQMKAATVAPHIHQITYPQATAPTSGGNHSQEGAVQQGVVDPVLANWALLQAAASLGPALSQLAAANIQQAQQQQQTSPPQPVQLQTNPPPIVQLQTNPPPTVQLQTNPPQPLQLQPNPLNPMIFQPQTSSQVPIATAIAGQPPDPASQLQAQQLQLQIQEQQAKLQQQLLQLNAQQPPVASSNKQDPAPQAVLLQPAPTMGSISLDPRSTVPGTVQINNPTTVVAEHFTKDLKEAYDLHLQQQQQQQEQQKQAAAAAAGKPTPSPVMGGFDVMNGLNLSSGIVGNIPTIPQQQQNSVGAGAAPRSDEDRAAGTALLGFLSSLRQSYEDALRDQSTPATAAPPTATTTTTNTTATNQMALFKSDSSDENGRTATVTDSNAGSNQPDSSVEDSDWNSDKAKTDPSSSEDSDKETPGRASSKRQKVSAEV